MAQFFGPIKVRGDYDLEDLENRCGTIQNMVPCKLIRVTQNTEDLASKSNMALFEDIVPGSATPKPKFLEVTDPTKIASMIAEQMQANRKLIFDSTIFVQSVETRVLGFR